MATAPEVDEPTPTPVQRVRAAVAEPFEPKNRAVTLLAFSAGLASMAPEPFGAFAAAAIVVVAVELRGKR